MRTLAVIETTNVSYQPHRNVTFYPYPDTAAYQEATKKAVVNWTVTV